jgi:hypothetical protein
VRSRAKAASAGSIEGNRRGPFRGVLAIRGAASGSDGSGAPARRGLGAVLALLALTILSLAIAVAPASAAEHPGVAVMGTVSNVGGGGAHVTGEVENGSFYSFYSFEYSTDEVNWTQANSEITTGNTLEPVSYDIAELKASTEYSVRLSITSAFGEQVIAPGPYPRFTTLPVDPPAVLAIADATAIFATSAKASGEVERPTHANPDPGFNVNCFFEYVTDAQFVANEGNSEPGFTGAAQAPCPQNPVKAADPQAVSATLGGLTPATTYHLRLRASNSGGDAFKTAANTFTTDPLPPPTATIDPVTPTADTAHFVGRINPGGTDPAAVTYWHFQCTPACPELSGGTFGAGNGVVEPPTNSDHVVESDATGLEPNTDYQVELVFNNSIGVEGTAQASFHTPTTVPAGETIPAFVLGNRTEAMIGGKVNPRNLPTKYWFEYGPGSGGATPTYPNSIPAGKDGSVGSGGKPVVVSQLLTGLVPGSTYHYRLIAENLSGTLEGDDVDVTVPLPPTPPGACPNAKLRTETNSAGLSECRAYEMTSAVEKGGGEVSAVVTTSSDGDRAGYLSPIGFGDSPQNSVTNSFMAQRGADGWATRPMDPHTESPNLGLAGGLQPADFSDDLSKVIHPNARSVAAEPFTSNILVTNADGAPQKWITAPTVPVSPENLYTKKYAGRSADASHIFFESRQSFAVGVPPGDNRVWEWVNGNVNLVSVAPDGTPLASVLGTGSDATQNAGSSFPGSLSERTAVSNDGSRAFFNSSGQLYVYEEGAETRQLSLSQRTGHVGEPAGEATFLRAAADGSIVYMRTRTQLSDTPVPPLNPNDTVSYIYSYNLETDVISYVSTDLIGVSTVSADGKRIYFVSKAKLVPGRGIAKAPNLYTSTDTGDVKFIATLSPDDGQDWGDFGGYIEGNTAGTTPDGSHYVFTSWDRLTAYDNAEHNEVYRYDVGDGGITCISCRPDGSTPIGDASLKGNPHPRGSGATIIAQIGRPRMLSDDGSKVFFETRDPLLAEDSNAAQDVYVYSESHPALISSGTSQYDSDISDNSPDGKNVFFTTRDGLVGQDVDHGAKDVYDARVDGGFPAPVIPSSCEGENCQRQPGSPPGFTSPATTSPSKGNLTGQHKKKAQKGCKKSKTKKQHAGCGSKGKKHQGKKHPKQASKNGRGK